MRHEETAALPLVQELLSKEGWDRVEKAAGEGKGLRELFFLVPWVADGLTAEQLETAFRSVGKPFKWLLALTRGRYARSERGGLPLRVDGHPRRAEEASVTATATLLEPPPSTRTAKAMSPRADPAPSR